MTNLKGRLIFDNGGGLTLQLPNYAHYYDYMDQAAEDVANYIKNGNTDGWEGHEEEEAEFDPTYDTIGCRVYSISEIIEESKKGDSTGWANIDMFCIALSKFIK